MVKNKHEMHIMLQKAYLGTETINHLCSVLTACVSLNTERRTNEIHMFYVHVHE